MKYRKKPVVIDAVQWDGTLSGWRKIEGAFPKMRTTSINYHEERNEASGIRIATLEGSYDVSDRDYIIRGVKGEFYPCKPDIFEMTYEKIEERAPEHCGSTAGIAQQANTAIALAERYKRPFSSTSVIGKVMDGFVYWLQEQQQ